ILKTTVEQTVERLSRYLDDARFLFNEAEAAAKASAMETAFQKYRELLEKFPNSPEAKKVVLPLIIESEPAGAKVWVNGVLQQSVTPLIFMRKPGTLLELTFRLYGYKDSVVPMVGDQQLTVKVKLQKVPVWSLKLNEVTLISPVTTDGRRIFITNVRGSIIALDAAEGKVLWEYKLQKRLSQFPSQVVSFDDSLLVVGSSDKVLHVIEKDKGSLFWQCNLEKEIEKRVLVANKRVFVAVEGAIFVINIGEKKVEKVKPLSTPVEIPLLYDEREDTIIVALGEEIVALDATSLNEVWSHRLPAGTKAVQEMVISGGFLVVPTNVGTFVILRRERNLPKVPADEGKGEKVLGREISSIKLGARIRTGVCKSDKMVFVCTDEHMVSAVDVEAGSVVWRYKLEAPAEASPVADKEHLLVVDIRGNVYAFKIDKGSLLWSDRLNAEVIASPAIVGQFLVVVTKDGGVFSYVR
ncbi:MAG: PQQ-binding-like beta-propeller repeat protein, partial [Planctomycetota bacterium]|nr:PQQ-binding-like beta-propeller repeat protein [Planctomycetota bacterium]